MYRGVIPEDRYHEPYMTVEELRREMSQMTFYGYVEEGRLLAVGDYYYNLFVPFREPITRNGLLFFLCLTHQA